MACVNEKGQLNNSAINLLKAIGTSNLTAQEIAKSSGLPLFKVRSSLREMLSIEFVAEENGRYNLTAKASNVLENR